MAHRPASAPGVTHPFPYYEPYAKKEKVRGINVSQIYRRILATFFYPNGLLYQYARPINPGKISDFKMREERQKRPAPFEIERYAYNVNTMTFIKRVIPVIGLPSHDLNEYPQALDCLRIAPENSINIPKEKKKVIIKVYGLLDCMENHIGRLIHQDVNNEDKDATQHAEAGFITYMFNLPGVCDSTYPMYGADDTVLHCKEFVKKIIEKENVDPENVLIYGHSLGGMFAILTAAELHTTLSPVRIRLSGDRSFGNFAWAYSFYLGKFAGLVAGLLYGLAAAALVLIFGFLSVLPKAVAFLHMPAIGVGFIFAIKWFLPIFGALLILGAVIGFFSPTAGAHLVYPWAKLFTYMSGWDQNPGKAFLCVPPSHRMNASLDNDPVISKKVSLSFFMVEAKNKFIAQLHALRATLRTAPTPQEPTFPERVDMLANNIPKPKRRAQQRQNELTATYKSIEREINLAEQWENDQQYVVTESTRDSIWRSLSLNEHCAAPQELASLTQPDITLTDKLHHWMEHWVSFDAFTQRSICHSKKEINAYGQEITTYTYTRDPIPVDPHFGDTLRVWLPGGAKYGMHTPHAVAMRQQQGNTPPTVNNTTPADTPTTGTTLSHRHRLSLTIA